MTTRSTARARRPRARPRERAAAGPAAIIAYVLDLVLRSSGVLLLASCGLCVSATAVP